MNILQRAETILTIADFAVGDFVHHRTWTVPPEGKQTPIVAKRVMRIVSITDYITCGGNRCFDAFELIKAN
jgi:hypothetical protein